VRGEGRILEEEEGTTMDTQSILLSKEINLHLLHFFYTSTPLLIDLFMNLRVGHKAELFSVFIVLLYNLFLYHHGLFAATYMDVNILVMKNISHE
jgi:hypothetical protein